MPIGPYEFKKRSEIRDQEERAAINILIQLICHCIDSKIQEESSIECYEKFRMIEIEVKEKDIFEESSLEGLKTRIELEKIKKNLPDRKELLEDEIRSLYEEKNWEVISVKGFCEYEEAIKIPHFRKCLCRIDLCCKGDDPDIEGYSRSRGSLYLD